MHRREQMQKEVAARIAAMLRQEYRRLNGRWWLMTLGMPARRLTPREVAWHTARRHAPFVAGGVGRGDPRW
jgi:hypothetical protein